MPLDDDQDPMHPETVTVSDPIVAGVDPVPDDDQEGSKEAYSEAGLSGEATANKDLAASDDNEPFMLRPHSDEEMADYDKGFACGQSAGQNDDTRSQAWQRGWAEAQE